MELRCIVHMVDGLSLSNGIEEYPFKRDTYYKLKKIIDKGIIVS